MKTVKLTDEEVEGLGAIIGGTIDTLIEYLMIEDDEGMKNIAFWNTILEKLGLEPILPAE